ncbi:site-specific integrase [Pseudoalteromonas sp. PA2MD11]|uniref:site-specific integrase n=1 Tax=Pseudoalteromonas sp. PA2MD11 TaxID=2785057 RepID=UPI001AE0D95F|nr:site-specific integrase [Pseudoalteromonas sp. PA2MD11]
MESQLEQLSILRAVAQLKKYKYNFEKSKFDEVLNEGNTAYFTKLLSLPVSHYSHFSDNEWDFNFENPNASANIIGSKLKINFSKYKNIPAVVVIEIKCLLMSVMLTPEVFINNRRKAKKRSIRKLATSTIMAHFKAGLRFLDAVFNKLKAKLGNEHVEKSYSSITQVQADEYRQTARLYCINYNDDLKQFFSYLQNPFTSENILAEKVPAFDTELFIWKKRYTKKVSNQVMPNWAFDKLIRSASVIIHDFLHTMGHDVSDSYVSRYAQPNQFNYCHNAGVTIYTFRIYRAFRLLNAGYSESYVDSNYGIPKSLKNSKGKYNSKDMTNFLSKSLKTNLSLSAVNNHLGLIAGAARYIIGQYTGMRPSELAVIKIKTCITEENGVKLLNSKVFKGKNSLSKGLFDDKWVVIPIINDAIDSLKILSSITQRDLLFSSTHTKKPQEKEKPQTSVTICSHIKAFINFALPKVDLGFSNYMMRHTLAYQLYRLEAGLPLISFQLKHLVNTVDKFLSRGSTSDVTMGYGGIADSLVESQTAQRLRKQSEIEVIKATADPDGNYLGGKATEHKERLRNAFKGYMASGYSKDEIFEAMAEQGLGVINVGLGYCYGSENTNESLPCIGSLRCNPNRCSNAIVSEANAPYWREVYSTNLANLNNPIYADNADQIKEVISEAKEVLKLLGHEVKDE